MKVLDPWDAVDREAIAHIEEIERYDRGDYPTRREPTPTNVEMAEYSRECRAADRFGEAAQQFIDDFENFLEGITCPIN